VQRLPTLFEPLRGLIDQARRAASVSGTSATGLYLLLGSASLDLIQSSSETLAGRIAFVELAGLHRLEVPPALWDGLWVRGGFPQSLMAATDADSVLWRRDFTRTYLERDVAQFAPRIGAELLRRFWTMLAHLQASTLNMAQLARNLGIDTRTANAYLDLLTDLLLVRKLSPWHSNQGKRLVKSPKVYIRDSGLLHSLLGIADMDGLLAHPVVGASWEGHVSSAARHPRWSGAFTAHAPTFSPAGNGWCTPGPRRTPCATALRPCPCMWPCRRWLLGRGECGWTPGEPICKINSYECLPVKRWSTISFKICRLWVLALLPGACHHQPSVSMRSQASSTRRVTSCMSASV
jgi:hypothetical protein